MFLKTILDFAVNEIIILYSLHFYTDIFRNSVKLKANPTKEENLHSRRFMHYFLGKETLKRGVATLFAGADKGLAEIRVQRCHLRLYSDTL